MSQGSKYMKPSSYKNIIKTVEATERVANCVRAYLYQKINSNVVKTTHPIVTVRDSCFALLKGSIAFEEMGLSSSQARGAIAEVMLENLAYYWLDTEQIDGNYVSNILLKVNVDTEEDNLTTQLDTLIITNKVMLVCECKSYSGVKQTDGITIQTQNITSTPWKQNSLHIKALKENIKKKYPEIKFPEIYNICYVFAEGTFKDWCQPERKNDVLLVNRGSFSVLNALHYNSNSNISNEDLECIVNYCKEHIPSVEEQVDHIDRLKKLFG